MSGSKKWALGVLVSLGLLFAGGAWWVGAKISEHNAVTAKNILDAETKTKELRKEDKSAKEAIAAALKSNTVAAWENAAQKVDSIEQEAQKAELKLYILPKRIAAYAEARDQLLYLAREHSELNQDDPRIDELIARAKVPQGKVLELLKDFQGPNMDNGKRIANAIPESLRGEWYRVMRSEEGHAHYSKLAFLTKEQKDEVNQAIQAALDAFDAEFTVAPRDNRAQHEVEALYQQKKKLNGASQPKPGDASGKKRPVLLPKQTPASTTAPLGNGI